MMRHRHRHHAHDRHHHRHHHGLAGAWRNDPAALRLWRVMSRMRVRVFLTLATAVGGGMLAGWMMSQPGGSGGWLIFGIAVGLWMLTGALAFKLTRRFLRVVEAARAIGDGELATRVERMPRWGEFAVLGDAINDMATRLQRQITDQKQLLAAVSHELRTPLGHMRILIDSGRERGEDPTMCDELEREVLRLDALVARLLTSSRLDFATLERRRVDVGQLVREALRAAGVGDEARVVIADPCEAEVDPTLVRSAVANLIDNAQRHGGGARPRRPRRRLPGHRRHRRDHQRRPDLRGAAARPRVHPRRHRRLHVPVHADR